MTSRAAATPHASIDVIPSGFPGAVYAVFGFGADAAAATIPAVSLCRTMRCYGDPGWRVTGPSPFSGAAVVLASDWSFSILCCDTADERALSEADAMAHELVRRGHMAILLGAGPSTVSLAALPQLADGRNQPGRILLLVPDQSANTSPSLANAAAALLS